MEAQVLKAKGMGAAESRAQLREGTRGHMVAAEGQ